MTTSPLPLTPEDLLFAHAIIRDWKDPDAPQSFTRLTVERLVATIDALTTERDALRERVASYEKIAPVAGTLSAEYLERAELAERDADSRLFDLSAKARDCAAAEARAEQAEAALRVFADTHHAARERYAKRYKDFALGKSNYDKMPGHWPMEGVTFTMGDLRRAAAVLEKETGP